MSDADGITGKGLDQPLPPPSHTRTLQGLEPLCCSQTAVVVPCNQHSQHLVFASVDRGQSMHSSSNDLVVNAAHSPGLQAPPGQVGKPRHLLRTGLQPKMEGSHGVESKVRTQPKLKVDDCACSCKSLSALETLHL